MNVEAVDPDKARVLIAIALFQRLDRDILETRVEPVAQVGGAGLCLLRERLQLVRMIGLGAGLPQRAEGDRSVNVKRSRPALTSSRFLGLVRLSARA